jgi:hypothetical protein
VVARDRKDLTVDSAMSAEMSLIPRIYGRISGDKVNLYIPKHFLKYIINAYFSFTGFILQIGALTQ